MQKTIIAKNTYPGDEYYLGITIECDEEKTKDPVQAMRDAAIEHILEKQLDFDSPFNWGDLVNDVSNETLAKHGIKLIDTFVSDLVVEHDESLKPQE